jgi:hypothetical protein
MRGSFLASPLDEPSNRSRSPNGQTCYSEKGSEAAQIDLVEGPGFIAPPPPGGGPRVPPPPFGKRSGSLSARAERLDLGGSETRRPVIRCATPSASSRETREVGSLGGDSR